MPRRPCTLEPTGSPKFLTRLSTHPTLFVDPGRSSESSPNRFLCVGFWRVNTIAICILLVTRRSQALGSADSLTGYVVPCVRFNCLVQLYMGASSTVATLGMSGWLDLSQPGLAPGKKRQASLGALTPPRTASCPNAPFQVEQNRKRAAMRWRALILIQASFAASWSAAVGWLYHTNPSPRRKPGGTFTRTNINTIVASIYTPAPCTSVSWINTARNSSTKICRRHPKPCCG